VTAPSRRRADWSIVSSVQTRIVGVALALLLGASVAHAAPSAGDTESAGTDTTEHAAGPTDATAESQANLKTEKQDASAKEPVAVAPAPEPTAATGEPVQQATFGHAFQFGLRAGVVFGYKMVFRYPHSPLCKRDDPTKTVDDQQKICGFGDAPGAEIALSFAPLDGVEPYVFGRFGFSGTSSTNTNALQLFGVGARIYTVSDARLKVFVEPALAFETEKGAGNPGWNPAKLNASYKGDLLFHLGVGPQYDFAKAFGIFLNGGIDVGVLRYISATLHVNVGAQLRFP
jgi:hypothetical protein